MPSYHSDSWRCRHSKFLVPCGMLKIHQSETLSILTVKKALSEYLYKTFIVPTTTTYLLFDVPSLSFIRFLVRYQQKHGYVFIHCLEVLINWFNFWRYWFQVYIGRCALVRPSKVRLTNVPSTTKPRRVFIQYFQSCGWKVSSSCCENRKKWRYLK